MKVYGCGMIQEVIAHLVSPLPSNKLCAEEAARRVYGLCLLALPHGVTDDLNGKAVVLIAVA